MIPAFEQLLSEFLANHDQKKRCKPGTPAHSAACERSCGYAVALKTYHQRCAGRAHGVPPEHVLRFNQLAAQHRARNPRQSRTAIAFRVAAEVARDPMFLRRCPRPWSPYTILHHLTSPTETRSGS